MATRVTDLPPGPFESGATFWYWLGGRPALDFVNTLRERWWRQVECLVGPDDLGLWLTQAGLLPAPVPLDPLLLDEARALREAIDACVVASIGGTAAPRAAVAAIDARLPAAALRPALELSGPALHLVERPPADPARHALGRLALDAAQMLGGPDRSRIRICASDTCSARFFDRSPSSRRQWCSMELCGNVAKARRHRARQQAGSA